MPIINRKGIEKEAEAVVTDCLIELSTQVYSMIKQRGSLGSIDAYCGLIVYICSKADALVYFNSIGWFDSMVRINLFGSEIFKELTSSKQLPKGLKNRSFISRYSADLILRTEIKWIQLKGRERRQRCSDLSDFHSITSELQLHRLPVPSSAFQCLPVQSANVGNWIKRRALW